MLAYAQEMLRKRHRALLTLLNCLLGLFLALLLLFFARDVVSLTVKGAERPAAPRPSPLLQEEKRRGLQEFAAILRKNPFGFPAGTLEQLSPGPDKAPYPAGRALIGTVAGSRLHCYAIFADAGGAQEVFRAGDVVPGMGRLVRIDPDRVHLREGGRERVVPLAESVVITEGKSSSDPGRPAGVVRSAGPGGFVLDQKSIQAALEKPNQMMTDARLLPHFVEGRQQGFALSEVKAGGIYQSLGLQNGDILLRINEYTIANPESALQAFNALRGMDRVQLDILRNNGKMSLTYLIK
ncbi:MAG: type II secretion system protein N [Thermodesulfovibrionales bacterium]